MLKIRYANFADAETICDIAARTFYNTYAVYNSQEDMQQYMQESFSIQQIKSELEDAQSKFLLITENENILGYAKITWRRKPVNSSDEIALEIARFYAETIYIGKGIGKFLMEECISIAKAGAAKYIWLDVWQENKKAIRFYQKWGFIITENYSFILGKDVQQDYIMEKRINELNKSQY
ncbi:MAG: GNAT family N-acetyltransferase [Chitinophagaceae bacterium]